MNRRVLLIDHDPDFTATLLAQLGPYRVAVDHEEDADRAIASCASDPPDLLVIAVEEPEKAGFRAFQKARKTLPAQLPIVLVTGSMAPDSFAKHRMLKVHADEYIDKRDVSDAELVGKIDNLIGLGEPHDDMLPVQIDDEIPMELAEGDVLLDEQLEEVEEPERSGGFDVHSQQTVGPSSGVHVDQMVAAETDAAFDALMGDEVAAVEAGHQEAALDPLDEDSFAIPEPVPHKIPDEISEVADAVPTLASPEADSIPSPIEDHGLSAAPLGKDSQVAIPLVDDDLVPLEDEVIEEVDELPVQAVPQTIHREPTPRHERAPERRSAQQPAVDLGLDKLAQDAASEQSGLYDRQSLRKIGELERQIAQLKTELDRARAVADAADRGGSRESQFLKLREERLAKETELKQVKTKFDQQSKELAEAQEKLRQAVSANTALETKSAELELEVTEIRAKNKELASGLKDATSQATQLEQELDAKTKAAVIAETALAQAEKDLGSERATRAASASESERAIRLERDQLLARHKGEMAMLRAETEAATELAIARQREEAEVEKRQAVTEAIEETKRAAAQERAEAIAAIEREHNASLVEIKGQQAAAVAAARAELDAEIEQLRSQLIEAQAAHVAAVAAAGEQHAGEVERMRAEHQAALRGKEEDHASAIERASIAHERAVAELQEQASQLETGHRHAIAELRSRNDQEVAQLTDAAKRQIETHRAELADEQAKHAGLLAAAHETSERQLAEQRVLLQAAESALVEAKSAHEAAIAQRGADHETAVAQLEAAHESAIAQLKAEHERALAAAAGELRQAKATADAEHSQAIAQLKAEADRMLRQLEEERDRTLQELQTECEELRKGLSGARDSLKHSQGELATAVQTIAERNHELRQHAQAIGERDQRITQLRAEIESLEQENASYQEQVLRAYQKIKSDEAMVARARKAMAIALTVLDDQGNPTSSS